MKKIWLIFVGLLLAYGTWAQTHEEKTTSNAPDSDYRFTKIALLESTPVESQGQAGTCWSFSALSFFESELIRKGNKQPDLLSEMYIVRKAYESKAEKYIRMDGKTNFSQGGAFHDIPFVIKKYGIVPQEMYRGLNYGMDTHNHNEFFNVLEGTVKGVLNSIGNTPLTSVWQQAINSVIDVYLGSDITSFEWRGKTYTPKSYAASIGLNMDDYVSLTSFTNHELYAPCMLEIQDNWAWGTSYNVMMDDLFNETVNALKNGYTIAWGADVSEKGFSFKNGLGIVPENPATIKVQGKDNANFSDGGADRISDAFKTPVKELTITTELRQKGYDNKTTTDDHGMHIVGLYKDQNGTNYFLVKNSWGTNNYPEGFLYVSENYFKYKTINIYLHKDGLSKEIKKKINLGK